MNKLHFSGTQLIVTDAGHNKLDFKIVDYSLRMKMYAVLRVNFVYWI